MAADALEALSQHVAEAASRLEALRASIHVRLRGAYWFGERADVVRRAWESDVGPALSENAKMLRGLSVMMRDVDEVGGNRTCGEDSDG